MTHPEEDWTEPAPGFDEQRAHYIAHLNGLIDDLHKTLAAATAMRDNPGEDAQHFYVQGVTLAGNIRQDALFHGEQMAATVHRGPAKVSLPRLAKALRCAVNTLRNHILQPGRRQHDTDDTQVF